MWVTNHIEQIRSENSGGKQKAGFGHVVGIFWRRSFFGIKNRILKGRLGQGRHLGEDVVVGLILGNGKKEGLGGLPMEWKLQIGFL